MTTYIMPLAFSFGYTEIIFITLIVIILFGGKKIPELMGGIGKGIKEFKKATQEEENPEKDNEKKDDK